MTGRLVVVSGPSGVGKTTVCSHLLERPEFERVITATTRAPREGEQHERDYLFLDAATFDAWVEQDRFLEWALVHGKRYGSPREQADAITARGVHALLNIDVQGAAQLSGAFRVFLLPPSEAELERRLRARGTDAPEEIAGRLETAHNELARKDEFDVCVVNDDSHRAADEIVARVIQLGRG